MGQHRLDVVSLYNRIDREVYVMNRFIIEDNPDAIARSLCDQHIVKMPLETAQMLCSVWHRHGQGDKVPYKEAHKKHPCTLWAGDDGANYDWLWQHGMELCFEYTRRYNKIHKCQQVIMNISLADTLLAPDFIFDKMSTEITPHPQCMPDEYKCDDTVEAYRKYYIGEKAGFAKWKAREVPEWFNV